MELPNYHNYPSYLVTFDQKWHYIKPYLNTSCKTKSTLPQSIVFPKSGHHGAIDLWNNSDLAQQILKNGKINFSCKFALETMEQSRFCPAKLWSNADFAPQNHGALIIYTAKSQSLHTLPREIIEQCRPCTAKSKRHSFRGQNSNNFLCKSMIFQRYNRSIQHFLRK